MANELGTVEVSIPDIGSKQLSTLLKYADQLHEIIEKSKPYEPAVTMTPVLRKFAEDQKLPPEDVRNIFSSLENLQYLKREFGNINRVYSAVQAALSADLVPEWTEKKKELIDALTLYDDDNPISISSKAQRLSRLYEKVFRDGEIITDARPIFDASGENLREIMIVHSFVVSFSHNGRTERAHLAMDATDVLKLRRACDRAIAKAKAIKSALGDQSIRIVQILRDDDDGSC